MRREPIQIGFTDADNIRTQRGETMESSMLFYWSEEAAVDVLIYIAEGWSIREGITERGNRGENWWYGSRVWYGRVYRNAER